MLSRLFQVELAREVFALPDRSLPGKLWLFFRLWLQKAWRVLVRRWIYFRARSYGERLRALVAADRLERVPCPLCGAAPPEQGLDAFHGLTLRRCPGCTLRYISPRLSEAGLGKIYDQSYFFEYRVWLGHHIKWETADDEILLCHRRLKRAELWHPPGRILDIGCSTGELLQAARERGYQPHGVELNAWAAEAARRERGLQVHAGTLESAPLAPASFDLITLIDVLEHLPDPLPTMRRIATLLAPAGLVLLVVPNGGCKEAVEAPLAWHHLKPWEHICLWDSGAVAELARRVGLELVDVETELAAGVGYPGALMAILRRAEWDHPEGAAAIFVRADLARGDTLLTIPVLAGIRRRRPRARLTVATRFPELLAHLDGIEAVAADAPAPGAGVVRATYVLDPAAHLVDAMARVCRAGDVPHRIDYALLPGEAEAAAARLAAAGLSAPVLALHAMVGARIKAWGAERWHALARALRGRGYALAALGSRDDCLVPEGAADLRGGLGLRESLALLGQVQGFVGVDSFLAHGAGAVGTPRVVLFGSTDPARILCDGERFPTRVVRGECEYLGCRHACLPDQWPANIACRRGDMICMESLAAERVAEAVAQLMDQGAPRP